MTQNPTESENTPKMHRDPGPFVRKPIYAGIISLVVGLFFVYILFFLLLDVVSVPSDPDILTITAAARGAGEERVYAAVSGGLWDCDSIEYVTGRSSTNANTQETRFTEAFQTDASGEILLFASLSGRKTCEELKAEELAGYLSVMSPDTEQDLINEVRMAKYIDAETYLEICGYCSPSNSWIGIIMSAVFLVLVLAFYPLMRRANRNWREYEEHMALYPEDEDDTAVDQTVGTT